MKTQSYITKVLFAILIVAFAFNATAANLHQELKGLNAQWNKTNNFAEVDPLLLSQTIELNGNEDLIQLHLQLVENTLRNRNTDYLTITQKVNRELGLNILRDYWQAGVFPKNTNHTYRIPYFIDAYNTACAVGHIMRESGSVDLATTVANAVNNAYIAEMPYQNELQTWANQMGFTVEELKWIQPTYGPAVILQASITGATCGESNGSISLTVTSGDIMIDPELLVLEWTNTEQGSEITGLSVGEYCVNVYGDFGTGELSWLHTECFTVGNSNGPQILSSTVVNESCAASNDGSIEIEVDDPNATITWYDDFNNTIVGQGNSISGLNGSPIYGGWTIEPQTYTAQITNSDGCITYETFFIEQNSELNAYVLSTQDSYCWEGLGSISLFVSDPNASILWSNGETTPSISNLNSGTYTVSIIDQFGCTFEFSVVIFLTDCPPPDCEFEEPFWLTQQLNNPNQLIAECICSIDKFFDQTTYQYYYFFDSNCNEVDAADIFYDCDGNVVCMTDGEISPDVECGADFTEGLLFHYNLFSCDGNDFLNAEDDVTNTAQSTTGIAILSNDTYNISNNFPLEGTQWNWFMQVGGFAGTEEVITDDVTLTLNNGIADLTASGISFPVPYTLDAANNQIVFDDIITTVLPVSTTFYYYIDGLNLVLLDYVPDGYSLHFIATTDLTINILTQPEIGEVTLNSNYTVTYTYNENMVPQNQSFTYEICTNILGAPMPFCDDAIVTINPDNSCNLESLVGYNISDYIGTDDIPQSYLAGIFCFKDSLNSDADYIDDYVWTLLQNNEIIETALGPVWCDVTIPFLQNAEPVTDEYTVCLTITDPLGCTAFSCIDIFNPLVDVLAIDDYVITEVNQSITINILENDYWNPLLEGNDPDVSVSILSLPQNGNILVGNFTSCLGSFCWQIVYIPDADFTGSDEVTYQLCINGYCVTATVYVNVLGNNNVINAVDDSFDLDTSSGTTNFDVLSNDDLDITPSVPIEGTTWLMHHTYGGWSPPLCCSDFNTSIIFENGIATLTIDENDFGGGMPYESFTFNYSIDSNGDLVSEFDVILTDNTIVIGSSTVPADGVAIVFYPIEYLSINIVTPPINGTVNFYNNFNGVYIPNDNSNTSDFFTYEVCLEVNGTISCDIASVYINGSNEICANDCVWPGDANADGLVDNFDLLSVALAYDFIGEPRENASIAWTPQSANNWLSTFESPTITGTQSITVNSKHADCDGSGQVNDADIIAIDQNYGLSHGKGESTVEVDASAPYLNIDIVGNVFPAGSTVTADISLGGEFETDEIENVYGVAFTINYNNIVNDVPLVVQETVVLEYENNNWLGNSFNTISIVKDFAQDALLETAYSRNDHQALGGAGKIASMSFVIEENVAGKKADYYPLEISIENAYIVNAAGELTPINTGSTTIEVVTSYNNPILNEQINVYPIPAQTHLTINAKNLKLKNISIYDITGKLVDSYYYSNSLVIEEVIYVEQLPNGLYFLQVETDEGILTQKVEIMK